VNRSALAGWVAAVVFGGASAGAAAKGIGSLLSNPQLKHVFTSLGGQTALTNAYLAALMSMAGLAAGAYGVTAVAATSAERAGRPTRSRTGPAG
jgi:ABC-2 type transport system permease protein